MFILFLKNDSKLELFDRLYIIRQSSSNIFKLKIDLPEKSQLAFLQQASAMDNLEQAGIYSGTSTSKLLI